MKEIIGTTIRHGLTLGAGFLMAKGIDISGIDLNELAASIATILAAGLSLAKAAKAKKEIAVLKVG